MERHFDEELAILKETLLAMCAIAETMISESVLALVEGDVRLLDGIAEQELDLDRYQIQIDEMCCRLIALHQPTASDLRFLIGAVKMNNEIERLGDRALAISSVTRSLVQGPPLKPFETIPEMVKIATRMVKDSTHAFVTLDGPRARNVIKQDDVLDNLECEVVSELIELMKQNKDAVERGIKLIFVAKDIERIGDLACNVAEDVIFMAEGEDVRHRDDT